MSQLPVSLEGTATTSGIQKRAFNLKKKLAFIANDSDTYDLSINFDKSTDEGGSFTLKAGEVVSDIEMNCSSISLKGIGGSVPFRALGV